jgi:formylmethanofuran dehydrogenase subunit E
MEDFETLLRGSAEAHGHLCPGQVIGVRLAMLGCSLLGVNVPPSLEQLKNLLVYVEIDRCATDAIAYVTGVKLGRRSLKFVDHGIMAATFVNLKTGKAFRIVSREDSRELAAQYAPDIKDPHQQQFIAYKRMTLDELFTVEEVVVEVPPGDLPGPSRHKATCQRCGIVVRDNREVDHNGLILCRPCAFGTYYRPLAGPVKGGGDAEA